MKRLHLILLVALTASAVSSVAPAQSVGFNMTGSIVPPTCDWSVGDNNRTIALDPIDARALPANGAAGSKLFKLSLEKCSDGVTSATFSFTGTSDPDDPLRYKNTGDAKGVAIELQSTDGKTVGANGTDNARTTAVVAGGTVLELNAAYWRIGTTALGTGTVTSVATVSMSYN
jgi:type 1 fimbria pilin